MRWLSFLIALLLAPAARAETHGLYLRTGIGIGYGQYWQIGAADRDVGGALVDLNVSAGVRLRPWFALGGAVGLQLLPAPSGTNDITHQDLNPPFSIMGHFGLMLAFLPIPLLQVELVIGAGGGGAVVPGIWGGFGLILEPSVTFNVFSRGKSHLGIDVRLEYAQLFAFDASAAAVRPFIAATAGVSYSFH